MSSHTIKNKLKMRHPQKHNEYYKKNHMHLSYISTFLIFKMLTIFLWQEIKIE